MNKVTGFLVLRKPNYNYDEEGRGAFSPYAPRIGHLYYSGIDRMPWFDLDESFYLNRLPEEFTVLRANMHAKKLDLSDYVTTPDVEKAIDMLGYSNRHGEINELAAIDSETLATTIGHVPCDYDIAWLGIDIYCHGYGSLVREGIFKKPEFFSDFIGELNKNGLFDSRSALLDRYTELYIKGAPTQNLEPIDAVTELIDIVRVGRVRL